MWKGVHCTQRHPPRCQASSSPDTGLATSSFMKAGSAASKGLGHLGQPVGRSSVADRPPPPPTSSIQTLLG